MPNAGEIILAADVPDTWTDWTPDVDATTTNPSLGNATLVGRYIQVGKLVHFMGKVTWGSTTTDGTGNYLFSVPVLAAASNQYTVTGIAQTGTTRHVCIGYFTNTSQIALQQCNPATPTLVSATSPFAPATGDFYVWSGTYEAA